MIICLVSLFYSRYGMLLCENSLIVLMQFGLFWSFKWVFFVEIPSNSITAHPVCIVCDMLSVCSVCAVHKTVCLTELERGKL
jgi:hypothetical protein